MALSSELINQLAKAAKPVENRPTEATIYGTVKNLENGLFVRLDGSDLYTPAVSAVKVSDDERVVVRIGNHSAVVLGNITAPAVRDSDVGTAVTNMETVITKYIDIEVARIDNAIVENLTATNAIIGTLQAGVAKIDTLIFGDASGDTIQTNFANAVIAQLGNAQIKSAMIENITASKIMAGDILTNNVRVMSDDGNLLIADKTIQISDGKHVRVQIGLDASDDYSINIWDAEGNLMFSEGGLTDSGIKEKIIRNDMISDTANISAGKLDIGSLFEEINGSTKTIKSSRVYLDKENQSLEVAFTSLSGEVGDLSGTMTSYGTQLNIIQGQINSKIWQQDINEAAQSMSTKYSELVQDLDGFKTTVKDTYATAGALTSLSTTVQQHAAGISSVVSKSDANSQAITTLEQTAEGLSVRVDNSAKTATNYLSFTDAGLVIGDLTASTLGNNVLIDSDSVDIRVGDKVLASYMGARIDLGKNFPLAVINLCGGTGQLSNIGDGTWNRFQVHSNGEVSILGDDCVTLMSTFAQSSSGSIATRIEMYTAKPWESVPYKDNGTIYMEAKRYAMADTSAITISSDFINIRSDGNYLATLDVNGYLGAIDLESPYIYLKGDVYVTSPAAGLSSRAFGVNEVLWSGGYYMSEGHTVNLSKAISAQPNGIVLVFVVYNASSGAPSDWGWQSFFIPKKLVADNPGKGHVFTMGTAPFSKMAMKYLYISNTSISGHANNITSGTASGITYDNSYFVLRYVYGV